MFTSLSAVSSQEITIHDFLLVNNMDQRISIEFFYKNQIKCSNLLEILNDVLSVSTMSKKPFLLSGCLANKLEKIP